MEPSEPRHLYQIFILCPCVWSIEESLNHERNYILDTKLILHLFLAFSVLGGFLLLYNLFNTLISTLKFCAWKPPLLMS